MTPDQMAQRIAEALNGGEWRDGRWYTEGQRAAWVAAVGPVWRDAVDFGRGCARIDRDAKAMHMNPRDFINVDLRGR